MMCVAFDVRFWNAYYSLSRLLAMQRFHVLSVSAAMIYHQRDIR